MINYDWYRCIKCAEEVEVPAGEAPGLGDWCPARCGCCEWECISGGAKSCLGCRDQFTETTDPRGDFCQRCWDKLSLAAGLPGEDKGICPF